VNPYLRNHINFNFKLLYLKAIMHNLETMNTFQDKEVRWGVLGVGNVCELKSAPAMNLIAHSKLVAVMRRNEAKVIAYAERHGVEKWYTDANQLINDPEVNAIYIATPPDMHMKYTLLAAAAGKPVYVEKPMARNFEECKAMVEVCSAAGLPLYVAYYRRALPHFVKIKQLIDEGMIGEVRTVHIELKQPLKADAILNEEPNWRVIPDIAGGGYFYDLASHQLDLLDYFFGSITKASGLHKNQAQAYPAEDMVVGIFSFESGVLGTGNWCFNAAEDHDVISIYGSEGKINFETFGKGDFYLEKPGQGRQLVQLDLPKHIQQPLIQTIVDDLLGTGTCPSTGFTAARTNWVMDEIMKGL
jgi:predicted dehydrogenase